MNPKSLLCFSLWECVGEKVFVWMLSLRAVLLLSRLKHHNTTTTTTRRTLLTSTYNSRTLLNTTARNTQFTQFTRFTSFRTFSSNNNNKVVHSLQCSHIYCKTPDMSETTTTTPLEGDLQLSEKERIKNEKKKRKEEEKAAKVAKSKAKQEKQQALKSQQAKKDTVSHTPLVCIVEKNSYFCLYRIKEPKRSPKKNRKKECL